MDPARALSAPALPDCRTPCAYRWRRLPATPGCPLADHSSQQFNQLPQRLGADLATNAHPGTTAKYDLNDAVAVGAPRPIAIRRDCDWDHRAAFDHRLRQQLPPPSEQLIAVHIVAPRHDRHDAPGTCVSATIWRFNASEYCRRFAALGCCLVSTTPLVDTCSA